MYIDEDTRTGEGACHRPHLSPRKPEIFQKCVFEPTQAISFLGFLVASVKQELCLLTNKKRSDQLDL